MYGVSWICKTVLFTGNNLALNFEVIMCKVVRRSTVA